MNGGDIILILIGKTASGKDSVVDILVNEHHFKKIITYTTRPKRRKEIQDITYHFITKEDFQEKIEQKFFLEYKSYNTTDDIWFYGSAKSDLENADDKSVIILTPEGYQDFLKLYPDKQHKSIYLFANHKTIKKRLLQRGDKKEESDRRLLSDDNDFKDVTKIVSIIIDNDEGTPINVVVDKIIKYLESDKN